MVDNLIERRDLPVPPPEADPTDAPVALDPPGTLDLRAEEIGSVIWCTGFGGPGPVVSRLLPASRYWRLPVS